MCDVFAACDAACLDTPLAEISYNSAVYSVCSESLCDGVLNGESEDTESYTQKTMCVGAGMLQ